MPLTGSAGPFRLRLAWPVATPASVRIDGLEVVCIPTFADVDISGQERTAIRICIEPR